ncbi:MAG: hypothetical protein GC192_11630 [Bacteroidetes bacterium]|nr:hypothetical protein [Bacteroidota bacterium]
MSESTVTPTIKVQGDGEGNMEVTSRGPCGCTVTAVSPSAATIDICGDLAGTVTCSVPCFSSVASLLTAGVLLNPSYNFNNTPGEPFSIINQNAFVIRVFVDCGGAMTYSNNIAASGGTANLRTDGSCNLSVCP